MLQFQRVQCENKLNPINVDNKNPSFSWILSSDKKNVEQTAFQIRVWECKWRGAGAEKLVWDSGKVESRETYGIRYIGDVLKSRSSYCYQIMAWDNQGECAQSEMQMFSTVVFEADEWQAGFVEPDPLPLGLEEDPLDIAKQKWQEYVFHMMCGEMGEFFNVDGYLQAAPKYPYYPAVMMFRKFRVGAKVVQATLYMTVHGVYEYYLNGKKGSDVCLAPEFTTYDRLLKYQVYDVTQSIHEGENAIGVVIADGWFKGKIANGVGCEYGTNPALFMELELLYEDGKKEVICSDEQFSYSFDGPYTRADIYNGETYDARKRIADFASVKMNTENWRPVHKVDTDKGVLSVQADAPIRPVREIEPVALSMNQKGELILDMGQNFAGHIRVSGMKGAPGTKIVFEHTEELAPDGSFTYPFTEKVQAQRDIYIMDGSGEESYEPAFTYHGFRYVRITGVGSEPWKKEQFIGIAVSSDNETAGDFRCSDEKLNQLQKNIVWSQISNMIGIPTDCPTREKAGWTGDVVVYAKTACFNQSLLEFYKEWLKSVRVEQLENGVVQNTGPLIQNYLNQIGGGSTGWGDVIITLPWELYQIYGEKAVLEENYPAMKKWMGYLEDLAYHQLPPGAENLTGEELENQHYLINTGFQFGDWLVPSIVNDEGFADGPKSSFLTGFPVATVLYANDADLMCKVAAVLGDAEAIAKYQELGKKIRKAFADTYLLPDGRLENDLQGLYIMALKMNMVPEEKRESLLNRLVKLIQENGGCMDTGFMSVPYILDVLSENGRKDEAYKLLYQNQCPSWLYEVERGATTMWESWNAIKPDGSKDGCSFNHYAFGCVGNWIYKNVLGIQNVGVGYDKVVIEPDVDSELAWVRGHYDSVRGRIAVEWEKTEEGISVRVEIPVNVVATVRLGDGVEKTVGSGCYEWKMEGCKEKGRRIF